MKKILLWFILIAGCKTMQKVVNENCDLRLDSAIASSWKYDTTNRWIKVEEPFLKALDSGAFDCIKGRDTTYVIKKFGRGYSISSELPPRIKNIDHIWLAVSYPILPCSKRQCTQYQFYFDEKGIVRKFGRIYLTTGVLD